MSTAVVENVVAVVADADNDAVLTSLETTYQYECRAMQTLGIASIMRFSAKQFLTVIAPTMKQTREELQKAYSDVDNQYAVQLKTGYIEIGKIKDEKLKNAAKLKLLNEYKKAFKERVARRADESSKLIRIIGVCYFDTENKNLPAGVQPYTIVTRDLIKALMDFLHPHPVEYVDYMFWYDQFSHSMFGCTLPAHVICDQKTVSVKKIEPIGTYGQFESLLWEKFYPDTQGCIRYAKRQQKIAIPQSQIVGDEVVIHETVPLMIESEQQLALLKYLWRTRIDNGVFTPPLLAEPVVDALAEQAAAANAATNAMVTGVPIPAPVVVPTEPALPPVTLSAIQRKNILVMPLVDIAQMTEFIVSITQNAINPLIDAIYFVVDMKRVNIPDVIKTFKGFFELQPPQKLKFRFIVKKIESLADIQTEITRDQLNQIKQLTSDPVTIGTRKPLVNTPAHKFKCNLLMCPLACWFDESIHQIQHEDDIDSPPYVYALSAHRYTTSDGVGRLYESQRTAFTDALIIPNFHRSDYQTRFKSLIPEQVLTLSGTTDTDLSGLTVRRIENAGFVVRNPACSISCFINANPLIRPITEDMDETILPIISIESM